MRDRLFHVAFAEIQWQDLSANARSALAGPVPKESVTERANFLYDMFLDACTQGPAAARAFLEREGSLQKQYLRKSEQILDSLRKENAQNQVILSQLAFATQVVKSLATVSLAIGGLFLAGPEIIAGAGIALGYDVVLELIKRTGHSGEPHADAVVVGFKQTAYNDIAGLAGAVQQERLEDAKEVLTRTLRYPLKSSNYRSLAASGVRIDELLKTLGIISAGVTLYSESKDVREAYDQMEKAVRPR